MDIKHPYLMCLIPWLTVSAVWLISLSFPSSRIEAVAMGSGVLIGITIGAPSLSLALFAGYAFSNWKRVGDNGSLYFLAGVVALVASMGFLLFTFCISVIANAIIACGALASTSGGLR